LRVLLDNLLGNAWKFTARQDHATLEVGREPGLEAFYVKDNGVGFAMDQAGRLFTPFQRLHAAEDFPGTGIGLALSRRIVGRHGGRIWIQAERGLGTTVYFTLQPRPRP
jgi:signal transduction histidine kinase